MRRFTAAILVIITLNSSDIDIRRYSSESLIPMTGDLEYSDNDNVPDLPLLNSRCHRSSSPELVLKSKENFHRKYIILPVTICAMLGLCYMGYSISGILHAGNSNGSN
jgi:hypothetical protein